MEPSIFTRIINGEIPCHKVYEDDLTIAFLDIHPIQPGQVLVVPKTQVSNFYDLDDKDYIAFFATVKKIAKQLKSKYPAKKRIGVMIEGLDVDHVHAKIFPIDNGNEYRNKPDMTAEPDHAELAKMAEFIKINSTYGRTSSQPEIVSGELKPILSGGGVPVGTPTTEKSVLDGRNSSDEAGILT